jgi:beta-lactamase superfamily II metal-dependent hydrolase
MLFSYSNISLGKQSVVKIPPSSLTFPSPSGVSWMFYGTTAVALLFQKTCPKLRFFLPILILGFLLISAHGILSNPKKGFLEADFLDAGDRNVVFIRLPEEKTILFDGGLSYHDRGGYIEERVVSPFRLKSCVTKINYLILTSLDRDHLEGVKSILQKFKVERLWTNGEKLDGELWGIMRDKNISWKSILDEVGTLDAEGVKIDFLKPRGEFTAEDSSKRYPNIREIDLQKRWSSLWRGHNRRKDAG